MELSNIFGHLNYYPSVEYIFGTKVFVHCLYAKLDQIGSLEFDENDVGPSFGHNYIQIIDIAPALTQC